jgi:hypothetical protein
MKFKPKDNIMIILLTLIASVVCIDAYDSHFTINNAQNKKLILKNNDYSFQSQINHSIEMIPINDEEFNNKIQMETDIGYHN